VRKILSQKAGFQCSFNRTRKYSKLTANSTYSRDVVLRLTELTEL